MNHTRHTLINLCFAVCVLLIVTTCLSMPVKAQIIEPLGEFSVETLQKVRADLRQGILPPRAERPAQQAAGSIDKIMPHYNQFSRIVYQSALDTSYELLIMDGNGDNPTRLINDYTYDGMPRLNNAGTEIVFVSGRDGNHEIYRMVLSSGYVQRLTNNPSGDERPVWSPDGKKIAWVSHRDGPYEIFVMNADGSNARKLTRMGADYDAFDPAWSPDGEWIAFIRREFDNDEKNKVFAVHPDGTGMVELQSNYLHYAQNLYWMPHSPYLAVNIDGGGMYGLFMEIGFVSTSQLGNTDPDDSSFPWTNLRKSGLEDLLIGSWSSDEQCVTFSRTRYTLSGNYLYYQDSNIELSCYNSDTKKYEQRIIWYGDAFFPDWRNIDNEPPRTVASLPQYSRSDGFEIDWKAVDIGLAGVTGFKYQVRSDVGQPFEDFSLPATNQYSLFYAQGNPGDQPAFRISSTDEAGNKEPWPANSGWTAATTLFKTLLYGSVADNRGQPLGGLPLDLSPEPLNSPATDTNGKYSAYLQSTESRDLKISAPGYGSLPSTSIDLPADMEQNLFVPPSDNLVTNGDFEKQMMEGWTTAGSASTSTDHLTGTGSAALGVYCPNPCIDEIQLLPKGNNASIVADRDGNLHVIYTINSAGVFYISKTNGSAWTEPQKIYSYTDPSSAKPLIMLDKNGDLIAVWHYNRAWVFYTKSPGQDWIYWHSDYDVNGCSAFTITPSYTVFCFPYSGAMAYGPDNTCFKFVASYVYAWIGFQSCYYTSYPDILYIRNVPDQLPDGGSFMAFDPSGNLHIFIDNHYFYRTKSGSWSETIESPITTKVKKIVFSEDGTMIVLARPVDKPVEVWMYKPGQKINPVMKLDFDPLDFTIDNMGKLVFIVNPHPGSSDVPLELRTFSLAQIDSQASISQSLTIPADMHLPTLTFVSNLSGGYRPGSTFSVSISDGDHTATLFSTNLNHDWSQHWAALDAWAGKTVTLTFSLTQSAGDNPAYLLLDDISLGSYLTPFIDAVSPTRVVTREKTPVLVITGSNFIDKPSVWIDGIEVDGAHVTFIDSTRLEVTLPDGLSAGYLNVKVANPGGAFNLAARAFLYGPQVFLPQIFRPYD